MYDFLDIEVHPLTGQVWVALVDNCNDHGAGDGVASCSHPDGSIDSVRRAKRGAVTSRGGWGVVRGGAGGASASAGV